MSEEKKPRRTQSRASGHETPAPRLRGASSSVRPLDRQRDFEGAPSAPSADVAHESPSLVACVIASSSGRASLEHLLRRLRADMRLAIVLVYHEDRGEERDSTLLALARCGGMPVSELHAGLRLRPGHVYVLPPGMQATLVDGEIELARQPGQHMAADVFLRSLARELKSRAIVVGLSGAGSEGALGLKEVKAEGGLTFVEDTRAGEAASASPSELATAHVDFMLGVEEIAEQLATLERPGSALSSGPALGYEQDLGTLFKLLQAAVGVDFSQYKKSTLRRRIQRRMTIHRTPTLRDYIDHLESHPEDVEALYQDLLIKVTAFFRDADAFSALKTHVFPVLMHDRAPDAPVRIWVPGCSTGEEVYSLAISLLEFLDPDVGGHPIQIFGTDISDAAIEQARAGVYIGNISLDVSPSRLRRFFVEVEGGYQVNKSIRDLCIFSRHNAAADPPFSRLDLVSCRNVMIYLEPSLQRRLLHAFHQALKPTGFLMLGSSESIGTMTDLFGIVDKGHKIFCKRSAHGAAPPLRLALTEPSSERADGSDRLAGIEVGKPNMDSVRKEADSIIVANYAPAGVVIDESMQIVQFRGKTGPYLDPAPGDASLHLFRMAREGLLAHLRAAVEASMTSGKVVRKEEVEIGQGDQVRHVDIEVWPLKARLPQGRCFLVVFTEGTLKELPSSHARRRGPPDSSQRERDLAATKEYLHAVIEQLEATNEELKSTNEELLSSNEELHRINDALEATQEELQSANEELTTVNIELQRSNAELGLAHDDLRNLLEGVELPILIMDRSQRRHRITPSAESLLNLGRSNPGRPLREALARSFGGAMSAAVAEALEAKRPVERQVQDHEGRRHAMRIRPYQTLDNRSDGVVVCWFEIDAGDRAERELARARVAAVLEALAQPALLLDAELRIQIANRRYCELFQAPLAEITGLPVMSADAGWSAPALERQLREVALQRSARLELHHEARFARAGHMDLSLIAHRVPALAPLDDGEQPAVLLLIEDATAPGGLERAQSSGV